MHEGARDAVGSVDVFLAGADSGTRLKVPVDCTTVDRWRELLGNGGICDKVLYAQKLVCRKEWGGRPFDGSDPLPDTLLVDGPGAVVKMLELALKKASGVKIDRGPPPKPRPPEPEKKQAREVVAPAPAPAPKPTSEAKAKDQSKFELPSGRLKELLLGSGQEVAGALRQLKTNGGDGRFRYFCAGLQGGRPYMEDRTLACLSLPGWDGEAALFGVFDGHGGDAVSEYSAGALPRILASQLRKGGSPAMALERSFFELDDELRRRQPDCGSTAVVVLCLREDNGKMRLICANCGDSRAVLARGGQAVDLSVDQKPMDPVEKARIEAAGGRVVMHDCWRVDGDLNLSRSLGDFYYKQRFDLPPEEQKISAKPEVEEIVVREDDEFVVIGSDGVFDVNTSQALVGQLLSSKDRGWSWEDAVDTALQRSLMSGDNVSLCLVEFIR